MIIQTLPLRNVDGVRAAKAVVTDASCYLWYYEFTAAVKLEKLTNNVRIKSYLAASEHYEYMKIPHPFAFRSPKFVKIFRLSEMPDFGQNRPSYSKNEYECTSIQPKPPVSFPS